MQSFPAAHSPEDHGGLDRAEKQERTGGGGKRVIGERKRRGVDEKRPGRNPAPGFLGGSVTDLQDDPKSERARGDPDESETGGVDREMFQRRATEERVAGEGEHRQEGEEK